MERANDCLGIFDCGPLENIIATFCYIIRHNDIPIVYNKVKGTVYINVENI